MDRPRLLCLQALQTWENSGKFADDILNRVFQRAKPSARDRAWVHNMLHGILRHRRELDFYLRRLRRQRIDRSTRRILQLGLYQIFHTRVPDHAAVSGSVELGSGRTRGVINAVLRRAIREKDRLEERLEKEGPPIRFSLPDFLYARWRKEFGRAEAVRLGEWAQTVPDLWVRVNPLKESPAGFSGEPCDGAPGFFRVDELPGEALASGHVYVQDPATRIACELLDPKPGDRVMDACAAPGGKAALVAAMAGGEIDLCAVDRREAKLERLNENLRRLGVPHFRVEEFDWEKDAEFDGEFDRILVDVPCSNTGVLRRKVDVRWRLHADDFEKLAERQYRILEKSARTLRVGGVLVYSTCSLEPEENEGVVDRFLESHPGWTSEATGRSLPQKSGRDGAAAFRLVRG